MIEWVFFDYLIRNSNESKETPVGKVSAANSDGPPTPTQPPPVGGPTRKSKSYGDNPGGTTPCPPGTPPPDPPPPPPTATSNLLQLKGVRAKSTINLSQKPATPGGLSEGLSAALSTALPAAASNLGKSSKLSKSMAQLSQLNGSNSSRTAAAGQSKKASEVDVLESTWDGKQYSLEIPVKGASTSAATKPPPVSRKSHHNSKPPKLVIPSPQTSHPQQSNLVFENHQNSRNLSAQLHQHSQLSAESNKHRKNSFVQFEKWLTQVFNPESARDQAAKTQLDIAPPSSRLSSSMTHTPNRPSKSKPGHANSRAPTQEVGNSSLSSKGRNEGVISLEGAPNSTETSSLAIARSNRNRKFPAPSDTIGY